MIVTRSKYSGVPSIPQYNWHFYAASLCALVGIGALLWIRVVPHAAEALLVGAAMLTAFWFLSSLLVSYYVYDYMGITRWDWIPRMLSFPPQQWLNIHAGLDESTLILTQFFPNTQYMAVDIYDPEEMTDLPSHGRGGCTHPRTWRSRANWMHCRYPTATAIHCFCSLRRTKSVNLLAARNFLWSRRVS